MLLQEVVLDRDHAGTASIDGGTQPNLNISGEEAFLQRAR